MAQTSSIVCLKMFCLERMGLRGAGGQSKRGIKDIAGVTPGLKEKEPRH